MHDLTINMLAAELGTSRRTIERAIDSGALVPTYRTASGRARFGRDCVNALKERAEEARRGGYRYAVHVALAPGPVLAPRRKRKPPPISARLWAQRALWKMQNLSRRKRAPTADRPLATASDRGANRALAKLWAKEPEQKLPDAEEGVVARKAKTAAAIKSDRLLGYVVRGLADPPSSRERAAATLRAIENLARHEADSDAEHIRKTAARLGNLLKRRDPRKEDVLELRQLLPRAVRFERGSYHFLATALPNLISWWEDEATIVLNALSRSRRKQWRRAGKR